MRTAYRNVLLFWLGISLGMEHGFVLYSIIRWGGINIINEPSEILVGLEKSM